RRCDLSRDLVPLRQIEPELLALLPEGAPLGIARVPGFFAALRSVPAALPNLPRPNAFHGWNSQLRRYLPPGPGGGALRPRLKQRRFHPPGSRPTRRRHA